MSSLGGKPLVRNSFNVDGCFPPRVNTKLNHQPKNPFTLKTITKLLPPVHDSLFMVLYDHEAPEWLLLVKTRGKLREVSFCFKPWNAWSLLQPSSSHGTYRTHHLLGHKLNGSSLWWDPTSEHQDLGHANLKVNHKHFASGVVYRSGSVMAVTNITNDKQSNLESQNAFGAKHQIPSDIPRHVAQQALVAVITRRSRP